MADGRVIHVVGPIVDVEFYGNSLPSLHNALRIDNGVLPASVHCVVFGRFEVPSSAWAGA